MHMIGGGFVAATSSACFESRGGHPRSYNHLPAVLRYETGMN
jgi:hypothetical protein